MLRDGSDHRCIRGPTSLRQPHRFLAGNRQQSLEDLRVHRARPRLAICQTRETNHAHGLLDLERVDAQGLLAGSQDDFHRQQLRRRRRECLSRVQHDGRDRVIADLRTIDRIGGQRGGRPGTNDQ